MLQNVTLAMEKLEQLDLKNFRVSLSSQTLKLNFCWDHKGRDSPEFTGGCALMTHRSLPEVVIMTHWSLPCDVKVSLEFASVTTYWFH